MPHDREGGRTKYEKIKKFRVFFANIHHRGTTWHATSASDARVGRLGPGMNHLTKFRNPIYDLRVWGPKRYVATSSGTWGAIYSRIYYNYDIAYII